MSEEIRKNELTDEQAEQVSGGRRRPRSAFQDSLKGKNKDTSESENNSLKAPSMIDTQY